MMKKRMMILAAVLAALVLLSACTPKNGAQQPEVEKDPALREAEAAVAEADAYPEPDFDAIFNGLKPREGDEEEEIPVEYIVDPEDAEEEGTYDEIVSYHIVYPQVSDPEFSALNALFEEDLAHLKGECSGAILEKASKRSCIATVEGVYDYYLDQKILRIDYDLSVAYSNSDTPGHVSYTVQYDLATCTRMEG